MAFYLTWHSLCIRKKIPIPLVSLEERKMLSISNFLKMGNRINCEDESLENKRRNISYSRPRDSVISKKDARVGQKGAG